MPTGASTDDKLSAARRSGNISSGVTVLDVSVSRLSHIQRLCQAVYQLYWLAHGNASDSSQAIGDLS